MVIQVSYLRGFESIVILVILLIYPQRVKTLYKQNGKKLNQYIILKSV